MSDTTNDTSTIDNKNNNNNNNSDSTTNIVSNFVNFTLCQTPI